MQKILKTQNYTLIFSHPDLILYGSVDGNLCVYQDEAEEFVKSFFSKDILSKGCRWEKDLSKAKQWLVGILYHEKKDSIYDIRDLTGYRSLNTVHGAIKKFGPLRSQEEGIELAFQKRYGKGIPEVMKAGMTKKWESEGDDLRRKISKSTSEGMINFWREKKNEALKS